MNILNTFNYIDAIIKTGFALKVNFIFYFRLNTCSNKYSIFKCMYVCMYVCDSGSRGFRHTRASRL